MIIFHLIFIQYYLSIFGYWIMIRIKFGVFFIIAIKILEILIFYNIFQFQSLVSIKLFNIGNMYTFGNKKI